MTCRLPRMNHPNDEETAALRRLLLLSLMAALAMFLPYLLLDGGRFTLMSDFNHQQIPFNRHSAWAIWNGASTWDWYTDLGVNFIGAFSFYTLGSPFFWMGALFPESAFPYLIGWLFILKYVAAALVSFLWLKRHVRNLDYAILGSLLYAFSGFSHINLMYYHFHEVIVFFPLLLWGMDQLLQDERRGRFALTVALCALLNYFFFYGQVLFLILYFFLFYQSENRRERLLAFGRVLGEGVLGTLAASILLIPSALFIISSPKASQVITGIDGLRYPLERYLTLWKALVFPAESMIRSTSINPWDFSSASLYLPGLGLSMVLAAARTQRLARRFLLVLLPLMLIPVLNSAFALFNGYYYARWFYMPLLILVSFSIQSLETASGAVRRGSVRIIIITALAFIGTLVISDRVNPEMIQLPFEFGLSALIALAGLGLTLYIFRQSDRERARKLTLLALVCSVLTGLYSIHLIRSFQPEETYQYAEGYFDRTAELDLTAPEGENQQNYRFYTYEAGWNLSMLNHIPSVNSFITTNSPSTDDFFKTVGIQHIAASLFPAQAQDLLTLLSVRYRVDLTQLEDYIPRSQKSNGFFDLYVSENPDFIPLGFPLDSYITRAELMSYEEAKRPRILLQALVIEPGDPIPDNLVAYRENPARTTSAIAREKRSGAVSDFQRDTHGFQAVLNAAQEKTLLFTVPWDSGWQATVNGQKVPIRKNLGFQTIQVSPGASTISFTYEIPGLKAGILGSLAGLIVIALLIIRDRRDRMSVQQSQ